MPFEKKVAQAGGSELRYLDSGTGSRAVVMLHGAGGLRVDERVFNALAEEYRLIAPSMPGFDDSTPGTATSVPEVADVMADFIRQVVGGPAAVIGESFGGNVASWLAIRHPDTVDALVLAAPGGRAEPRPTVATGDQRAAVWSSTQPAANARAGRTRQSQPRQHGASVA